MIMKTSLDLLQVLIAVGDSRNFREAADKLRISQPAVSHKLKELESFHSLPLFVLEGKRKVLTHYGRALYQIAKEETVSFERGIEALHRLYSSGDKLTIKIGGRSEVLEAVIPHLDFSGRIELIPISSREAIERLLRHEIDIAISYERPDSTEFQAKKLFQSKTYFAIHRKLLKKKSMSPDLLRDPDFLSQTPCVAYSNEGHLIRDLIRPLSLSFDNLNIRFISEDWRTIQFLVSQGEGYAVIPSYVQTQSPDVLQLEIPNTLVRDLDFFAIFEKGLKKIKAFQGLLAFKHL
jgi:DNA-binding transcriptional LysR family regulator